MTWFCRLSYSLIYLPWLLSLPAISLISSICQSCSSMRRFQCCRQSMVLNLVIQNIGLIQTFRRINYFQVIIGLDSIRLKITKFQIKIVYCSLSFNLESYDNFITMAQVTYPVPPSHRTFNLGNIVIDSNFDSGNCSNAQKVSNNNFNIWIGTDHPKNNYRTWFHFSIQGLAKGTPATFKIKNMQNQSRLLYDGLVPVYREEGSTQWKRIKEKINTNGIEFNDGWIQWTFKHTMTSSQKTFFAFFYPWSNQENQKFLTTIKERCDTNQDIYFHRTTITKSLQGRPVQFLTISSKKGFLNKDEPFDQKHLFLNQSKPKMFNCDKKCIIISARVHPGQVPSSHVMTGIIDELTKDNQVANTLRDKVVFYIFPILNPDGVARGHYRVDTNGINLNRCYINPSPKEHSSIYAVKKVIMHLHENSRYFGFLDLHAHASRKGIFIYGNSTNQLEKQVETCLFPKILSMNSQNFEYEGSNFTQKNMYIKERGDHVSKEGSGRVAIFKATKNAFSWTLECNYNMNRGTNILQPQKSPEENKIILNQNELDDKVIVPYRNTTTKQPNDFYTIETYRKLGRQICESFLDLLESNPVSRIQNPKNYFKSVQNLKMNLAIGLLRMAPNRFQTPYKKIYYGVQNKDNPQIYKRSIEALYLMLIKKAKIQNLNEFLKSNIRTSIVFPVEEKKLYKKSLIVRRTQSLKLKKGYYRKNMEEMKDASVVSEKQTALNQEFNDDLRETGKNQLEGTMQNQQQTDPNNVFQSSVYIQNGSSEAKQRAVKPQSIGFFLWQNEVNIAKKVFLHVEEIKMIGINKLRKSIGADFQRLRAKGGDEYNFRNSKPVKIKYGPLPSLESIKTKSSIGIFPIQLQPKEKINRIVSSKKHFENQQ